MVSIDVDLVTQLIATQFPQWAHLPVTPVRSSGWDNRTFHLGDQMSVRLPSGEHYADAVAKEQLWLPRLAPQLPLPIPRPLAHGAPGCGYPWHWSVYGWLEGEVATRDNLHEIDQFAVDLAQFLRALQRIDTRDGPTETMRGGPLDRWDRQMQAALTKLAGEVDVAIAADIWERALSAPFHEQPVWYHGDIAAGNLLVQGGKLSAVIDFGGLGVGDPGCDTTIAWTLLTPSSRQVFRERLNVSEAIWNRGQGWALWKAMIVVAGMIETNVIEAASSQYAIDQLMEDHVRNHQR